MLLNSRLFNNIDLIIIIFTSRNKKILLIRRILINLTNNTLIKMTFVCAKDKFNVI